MNNLRLAMHYSKNFVLVLKNDVKKIKKSLKSLLQIIVHFQTNPEMTKLLEAHLFSSDSVKKILESLYLKYKIDELTSNFINVIVKNNRLSILDLLPAHIELLILKSENVKKVKVEFANSLSALDKKQLESLVSDMFNSKTLLEYVKNDRLVSGIRIVNGDYLFDYSLLGQMRNIRKILDH